MLVEVEKSEKEEREREARAQLLLSASKKRARRASGSSLSLFLLSCGPSTEGTPPLARSFSLRRCDILYGPNPKLLPMNAALAKSLLLRFWLVVLLIGIKISCTVI